MSRPRVAINGLGRIGRLVLRNAMEHDCLEVVAVNDIAPLPELVYLLRHDSIYPEPEVAIGIENDALVWGERRIPCVNEPDPEQLPWGERDVDIVIEASGRFTARADAGKHLAAGASFVLITAPAKEPDATFCVGVNEEQFDPQKHHIVSNASCTTNALAPVAQVLDERFGIVTGFLTTIHAFTSSQALVDTPNKKHRRGRAAAISIVPTTTGAARTVAEVLPQLAGKLNGMAFRVPVADGSVIDFVVQTRKPVTVESVNAALTGASREERLAPIMGVTEDELVSADIVGMSYSALVDLPSTMVLGDHTAKVIAWYDNEWGYARRVVDLASHMAACATPVQVAPAYATSRKAQGPGRK